MRRALARLGCRMADLHWKLENSTLRQPDVVEAIDRALAAGATVEVECPRCGTKLKTRGSD